MYSTACVKAEKDYVMGHANGPLSSNPGLILGLLPANERRRYFVTTSLIG